MKTWLEEALATQWPGVSHEETIKVKMLFLNYLGHGFAKRGDEEGVLLAEHLLMQRGDEQATLFATPERLPSPQAALGNAALVSAPLLYPVVLAAIEQQNKGGQELLAALVVAVESSARMGDHPQAELVGALVGVAHAFDLEVEEGWSVLLGLVTGLMDQQPSSPLQRGLLAQGIVQAASLAREGWSATSVMRGELPASWGAAFRRTSDKPGLTHFLQATMVNADQIVAEFRELVEGKIPPPHVEYYIDAVMGLEDICCVPLFFRR